MRKSLVLLLAATLLCFVALGWNYVSYCGYRERVLMSSEPIVRPFLGYGYTFNLLFFMGFLGCLWIWAGHNYRKARTPMVVLSLLVILGLTVFVTPIVKAEDCEINVVVALDEEFRDIMIWRGINLPPWTGREFANLTVEDLNNTFYSSFNIVFNVAWVDWDSNDDQHDSYNLALEAHNENPHEGAMLWAFTNQDMAKEGQAIPWKHVQITKWILPRFWFVHTNTHEIGHLFNCIHCNNFCVMNTDRIYDTVDFCTAHTDQINFWKWNWQDIEPPQGRIPGDDGGGGEGVGIGRGLYPK